MRSTLTLVLSCLASGLAFSASESLAQTFDVDVSVNVFPSDLQNPNGGGTWTIVAKTNSPIGIAGIRAVLYGVNPVGLSVESDIGHWPFFGNPPISIVEGAIIFTYFQDNSSGPIVAGVGTPSMSDGPDPLNDPAWDDATLIFAGLYNSTVPSIAVNIGPQNYSTDANTLASLMIGQAAVDADTSIVVRVAAVPEPSTLTIAACGLASVIVLRRRVRG